ncbi:MAG TPA: histidine kinase [Mobilitalea sp.]|nr:histidine kinase [Mobilitalea sp.]
MPFLRMLFRNTNVKKQLNFIYFTSLLLPVFIIGIILILNANRLLLDHYQNLVESDNTRVKSIMFDVTTTVYNISDEIFRDKSLQTFLSPRYSSYQEAYKGCTKYYNILSDYITRNTFISSIDLYTTNPTIISYASIKPITDDVQNTDWYSKASSHADVTWRSLPSADSWNNISHELCLIRRIPVISTGEYAVLVIKVSNIYLKNRIQNNSLYNIVTVNQDPVFFSTKRGQSGQFLTIPVDYDKQQYQYSGELDYEGNKNIAQITTLVPYSSKDKIYIATMDSNAFPDTTKIILIITVIIFLGSIIPYIIFTIFTQRFSTRIITLRGEMHKASKGDYNIIDNFNGNDELSDVFSDLKLMIHSIKLMDSQMYEAKIQEQVLKNQQQKMEFKMLASQINPHFLYNTLETIRMKALMEGNPSVANAIKLLGKSMHYVLENNGTSSTTLQKELDYISTYLAIQKLRFNDRVNYTLHVPENLNLEECRILPLLLQPVVENSISHGLERAKYVGYITIDVQTQADDLLIIKISDNGLGMTQEQLTQLNTDLQTSKRKSNMSIGLYNINQRIKLFYGETYGIELNSRLKEGTLVTFTLPLHTAMEE